MAADTEQKAHTLKIKLQRPWIQDFKTLTALCYNGKWKLPAAHRLGCVTGAAHCDQLCMP